MTLPIPKSYQVRKGKGAKLHFKYEQCVKIGVLLTPTYDYTPQGSSL